MEHGSEAVVFDMDGVIVDSEVYWEPEKETIIEEALVCDDDKDEVSPEDLTGINVLDQYELLSERGYEMAVTEDEYFDLYDSRAEAIYTEKVSLTDGFDYLLNEIRERGLKTAISTSSFPSWVEMVLERFELEDSFDVVVSADEIDVEGKPEPDIYEYVASELGVDPEDCIVVEDSETGIESARRSGAYCIGYSASGDPDHLENADEVARDPGSLRDAVVSKIEDAT
ncbi:HAD family hydrolase [Halorutilales archaeon Cl-col2-1]